jgi:hypothetical protein
MSVITTVRLARLSDYRRTDPEAPCCVGQAPFAVDMTQSNAKGAPVVAKFDRTPLGIVTA